MSVNSRENKGLLWQLLSNHPFQKEDSKKFQAVLEYRVNEIHKNRFRFNNNLMSMNKEIIKQFANEVPKQTQPTTPSTASQPSKAKVFETRLKVQQDNFDTLINKQKPAEIDFSDKTEEAPVDARMVDNTLQQREQELKKIMSQYNNNTESTTTKWLQSESTSSSKNLKIDKDSNVKIKPFVFDSEKSEKHVSFEIEEKDNKSSNAMSFLTKLKKTNVKEEVISYLKRIEEKQDIIITLLQK